MLPKLFCFLLAVCCWATAFVAQAQADFRAGYVLPLSGDTLRGLADYRDGARNTEFCRFRPTPNAEVVSYTPAQIRGYGFRGGRQFRTQLLVPTDSVQYAFAPPPALVFMEVLAAGPLTLYHLRSKAGADRFFLAPASQLAGRQAPELVARRPAESESVTRAYRNIRVYRGVLTELLAGCDDARMRVASLPFTASALMAIVQRYNACGAPAPEAAVPAWAAAPAARPTNSREKVRFGVLLGAESSQLVMEGEGPLAKGRFVSSPLPVLGIGLNIPLASLNERFSVRFEALVEQQRYADNYLRGASFGGGAHQQTRLHLTYLRVPLMARYTYPAGRLRPFVQAGVSYGLRLHFDTSLQTGYANSSGVIEYNAPISLDDAEAGEVNQEIGFMGSVGVHLPVLAGRALTLELRAERGSGLVNTANTASSSQRYFALLGYNLTK